MLTSDSIAIIATNVVLAALGIAAVGLRLLARHVKNQVLGIDDILISIALVVLLGGSGGIIAAAIMGGIGHHSKDLSQETAILFLKFTFALQFPYLASVTLIKLSILLFYRRVFHTPRFKTAVWVVCSFVIIWFITFVFTTVFQVIPIKYNWDIETGDLDPSMHKINVYAMYISTSVTEIFLDLVTFCLPMFVIWRLQMRPSQKLAVSGIFLLGAFVCVASIVRIYYLSIHLNPSHEQEEDLTYNLGDIVLWSSIEPCFGLICACLPTLGPVINQRSLQSIVVSLRSLLRVRSKSDIYADGSLNTQYRIQRAKEETAVPLYLIDDQHSLSTQIRGREGKDESRESFPSEGIRVNRSFDVEVGGR